MFYRSHDHKCITSIGVVEETLRTRDPEELQRFIGARSVYSEKEIQDFTDKDTLAILFTSNIHLPNPIHISRLTEMGFLKNAPRSITEINHNAYIEIVEMGGVDERFVIRV